MNMKIKAKWLKALRSGLYRRGQGELVSASGVKFCCLGVLADIQGCEWQSDLNDYHKCGLVPIKPGARNPIVPHTTDTLPPKFAGGLSRPQQTVLANMNDNGASFRKIADHIEQNL